MEHYRFYFVFQKKLMCMDFLDHPEDNNIEEENLWINSDIVLFVSIGGLFAPWPKSVKIDEEGKYSVILLNDLRGKLQRIVCVCACVKISLS